MNRHDEVGPHGRQMRFQMNSVSEREDWSHALPVVLLPGQEIVGEWAPDGMNLILRTRMVETKAAPAVVGDPIEDPIGDEDGDPDKPTPPVDKDLHEFQADSILLGTVEELRKLSHEKLVTAVTREGLADRVPKEWSKAKIVAEVVRLRGGK